MAIEVRELVIKGTVRGEEKYRGNNRKGDIDVEKLKKEIIDKCMRKVMEEIKRREHR